MILVIDNYDSFTYNLVQLLGGLNSSILVKRNDDLTLAEIEDLAPSGILVSPGPGRPEHAGISMDVVKYCGKKIPVLGVCLGHQAIGAAFGGHIVHAPSLMHGRTSNIYHDGQSLFDRVPTPFVATRYHSLVISPDGFPSELQVTARTDDGVIMGVRHRTHPVEGVQFHPESVLTTEGPRIIRNWLKVQQCL
jgi:anthranilate synthase/aminodeoxychorismate synthase-like glutamine amidotransferase